MALLPARDFVSRNKRNWRNRYRVRKQLCDDYGVPLPLPAIGFRIWLAKFEALPVNSHNSYPLAPPSRSKHRSYIAEHAVPSPSRAGAIKAVFSFQWQRPEGA